MTGVEPSFQTCTSIFKGTPKQMFDLVATDIAYCSTRSISAHHLTRKRKQTKLECCYPQESAEVSKKWHWVKVRLHLANL